MRACTHETSARTSGRRSRSPRDSEVGDRAVRPVCRSPRAATAVRTTPLAHYRCRRFRGAGQAIHAATRVPQPAPFHHAARVFALPASLRGTFSFRPPQWRRDSSPFPPATVGPTIAPPERLARHARASHHFTHRPHLASAAAFERPPAERRLDVIDAERRCNRAHAARCLRRRSLRRQGRRAVRERHTRQ
jgi:hypothetical protein